MHTAHTMLCFIVTWNWSILPITHQGFAPGQSYDCPNASETTVMDLGKLQQSAKCSWYNVNSTIRYIKSPHISWDVIYLYMIWLYARCRYMHRDRLFANWLHPHSHWAFIRCVIWRLIVKSREVSKPRDQFLKVSYRSEIWKASRQQRLSNFRPLENI